MHSTAQALFDLQSDSSQTEENFKLMIESVTDCSIIMLDPDGLIKTWNSGARQIHGFEAFDAIGKPADRLFTPDDIAPQGHEHVLRLAATTGRSEINVWRVRRDGTRFWANVVLTPMRDCDNVLRGYTEIARDMTERRRVEAELNEARATAEAANKAKSDFLSHMSHELRTPLNAVIGFAQLMESDRPKPTPNQTASIDQILQAGWYLLTLIDEVLDLSLIETGKLLITLEPLSVAEVLTHCQSMMEPLAQKRGITMTFPTFESPCFVMADRTRLRQVFVNLLTNAIKYNRPYGNISVNATGSPDGYVRFSVRDTGMGLTAERIVQLYQPFNRLGQEAGPEQGTGIGLVVTKRLVEAMNGAVGVESEVGVGTVFWVDLVATDQDGKPTICSNLPTEPSAKLEECSNVRTVLYIEDNPANLKLVDILISRRADLQFLSANTGELGLELARSRHPSVILMDINLPGTSGVKLMATLRENPDTAHIPIIALSANADPREIERGVEAGFMRYLTKPVIFSELMKVIDLALSTTVTSVPET